MAISWTTVSRSVAMRRVGLEDLFVGPGTGAGPYRLHVQFLRGETYVYRIPDPRYYAQMVAANSIGRYYVEVIKAKFDYCEKY